MASEGGSALDRLKKFMKWRSDEEEKKWEAETGLNLLTRLLHGRRCRPLMNCFNKMRREESACSQRREKYGGKGKKNASYAGASRWGRSCWNLPK